jgi:hypothetical protein
LTALSFVLLLGNGGNISWTPAFSITSLTFFLAFLAIFLLVETKFTREPIAPPSPILSGSPLPVYLLNLAGFASGMIINFNPSLYLQAVPGQTATVAGRWLVLSTLGAMSGKLGGGMLI